MSGNGEKIIALDAERMQAMVSKDYARLDELIADDLIYTHSSARLDSKQTILEGMRSGATVYAAVEASEVQAQDLGDAVVLTGAAQITVLAHGKPNRFGVRFTDVYARRGDRWQMVTWQSTRTP